MITLTWAKQQLRITSTAQDEQIERHILRSEEILFGYLGYESEEAFYYEFGEQHFYLVETALLMMVQSLHDEPAKDPLTKDVKSLVRRFRNPRIG